MDRSLRIALISMMALAIAVAVQAATAPVITTISPQKVIAGTGGFTLTVNGAGFVSGASVRVNGTSRTTTFVSASRVTAAILSSDVLNAATLQITATNPGSLPSSAVTLTVLPNAPTISSLDPSSELTGTTNLTLTVNGSNFDTTAQVQVNLSPRVTTFVSDTQLSAKLTTADVANPITLQITVLNPNSKTSNAVPLTVKIGTASPTITVISPSNVVAGGNGFTLSVVGTNFVKGAVVKANGSLRTTTFVDSSHLTVQMQAADIVKAGTILIAVFNPDGTSSATTPLTVTTALLPEIVSLSPQSVTAGAAPFQLTINGSNFATGATVTIGSNTRNGTVSGSTVVTAPVVSADVLTAGQVQVTVTNPPPNGGTSNALPLYVTSTNAPVVSSVSPATVLAGSDGFNLTISGSGFLLDDVVQVGGSARTTQFFSATQLAAAIPASDILNPGTLAITVARKNGSDVSAPQTLTVIAASAPAITGFNPPSATVGQAPFTLAVLGQHFDSNATVVMDGVPRTTQYIGPTELDVQLTASDLAAARTISIRVVNSDLTMTDAVLFTVATPQIAISSLNPPSVASGAPDFTLTVVGTNFSQKSQVNINGVARTTQLQGDGSLTTTIAAADISAPGALAVTVTDSGATSAAVSLNVLRPVITSVDPTGIVLGTPTVTITVFGTSFLSTSKVIFLGSEQPTTRNADGSLSATLSGLDTLDLGTYAVSVRNSPDSISVPFLIQLAAPGAPQIVGLSPSSVPAGSPDTVVIVSGTNFVSTSVVRVNGANRTTVFNGANSLSVTLLAAELKIPGQLKISVVNPGGAVSADSLFGIGPAADYTPPRRRTAPH